MIVLEVTVKRVMRRQMKILKMAGIIKKEGYTRTEKCLETGALKTCTTSVNE